MGPNLRLKIYAHFSLSPGVLFLTMQQHISDSSDPYTPLYTQCVFLPNAALYSDSYTNFFFSLRVYILDAAPCLKLKIYECFSSVLFHFPCAHLSLVRHLLSEHPGCVWPPRGPQTFHHTNSVDFQFSVIAEQAVGWRSGVAHRASPIFILNKIFYGRNSLKR